jgi:DNA-binding response OmpR family regulator
MNATATSGSTPAAPGPNTVFIIDDDEDLTEALELILRRCGYVVATAKNGAEALHRLAALDRSVCLILLDLMMPVMDGWQFRAAQLRDQTLARIPVVVLSGRVDVVKDGASVRAAEYVRKPIDIPTLLAIVRAHCGGSLAGGGALAGGGVGSSG